MSFFGGAVTTCTFTMAMMLSQKARRCYQSGHYTVLSTVEVLGKILFSASIGSLADHTSYQFSLHIFTFLSFVVIPLIFKAPAAVVTAAIFDNDHRD